MSSLHRASTDALIHSLESIQSICLYVLSLYCLQWVLYKQYSRSFWENYLCVFLPFEVWPQEGRSVRDLREGRERLLGNLESSENVVKSV